ncbi:MAG TPA: hypothetical protein VMH79_14705 [Thermoanaerobaculia bacterium]|nr:hypothetical protein [Thermoanaerobaculia bacterium]
MSAPAGSLLEQLASRPDRFPGALLLTGPSAARLEQESRRLAAKLLCPGDDPDGTCRSCRRVEAGIHPDLLTIEPEGSQILQIRVDRVREALVFAAGRPYESARRVARVVRAELLGTEAGNALLKTLEEPGERFRWILTSTRPEALLSTIRSRTTPAALPAPGTAERERAWRERGFPEDDAHDLVLFAGEDEKDPATALAEGRARRAVVVGALEEGLAAGNLPALVLCAEALGNAEPGEARILSELLADAALAAAGPPAESLRHRAVAGRLAALARKVPAGALRDAAVAAADAPPDKRRGNRRLHFEKVLLALYGNAARVGTGAGT